MCELYTGKNILRYMNELYTFYWWYCIVRIMYIRLLIPVNVRLVDWDGDFYLTMRREPLEVDLDCCDVVAGVH